MRDREERWVQVSCPAFVYVRDHGSVPTGPWFVRHEAERLLKADGCNRPVEFLYTQPWVDGSDTRTHTFRSSRPSGQPKNSSGVEVDDSTAPHGLAPSDKHTPSPDGTHRGQSGSSTHPGPAASGNGAGDPTPGT